LPSPANPRLACLACLARLALPSRAAPRLA